MTDENTRLPSDSVVEAMAIAIHEQANINLGCRPKEFPWANAAKETKENCLALAKAALAAQPRDDVRELLREARDFLFDTQGTDSVGHRLALRIDTALAPTTQGTEPSVEAMVLSYKWAHEDAVSMGYPSLTEALEHLAELKEQPETDGEGKVS